MKICQQQDEGYTWQSEKMVAPANQKKKKKRTQSQYIWNEQKATIECQVHYRLSRKGQILLPECTNQLIFIKHKCEHTPRKGGSTCLYYYSILP